MKPHTHRDGYLVVKFSTGNTKTKMFVHTAVLATFIGPRPAGMECRHLDGNKTNCRLDNLAWGTRSENQRDRATHGTRNTFGEQNPAAKLTAKAVAEIRKQRSAGSSYYRLAKIHGVHQGTIRRICLGVAWKQTAHVAEQQPLRRKPQKGEIHATQNR